MAVTYGYARGLVGVLVAAILVAAGGCAIPVRAKDGSRHYVVVGFGMVSIPRVDASSPVLVAKVQALGVVMTPMPSARLVIGYINAHQVAVAADTAWAMVEISDAIAGPVRISASTCQLAEKDQ